LLNDLRFLDSVHKNEVTYPQYHLPETPVSHVNGFSLPETREMRVK